MVFFSILRGSYVRHLTGHFRNAFSNTWCGTIECVIMKCSSKFDIKSNPSQQWWSPGHSASLLESSWVHTPWIPKLISVDSNMTAYSPTREKSLINRLIQLLEGSISNVKVVHTSCQSDPIPTAVTFAGHRSFLLMLSWWQHIVFLKDDAVRSHWGWGKLAK